MILRLKLYRLCLKLAIYSLPFLAFKSGWYLWIICSRFLDRPTPYSPQGHFSQILFAVFVWAFMAEHYRVTSFDELFRERTGARAAWSACLATSFVLLAALYFARNSLFPRGLLICDITMLPALTILLHALFRSFCRSRLGSIKPTRLLIIGADRFARTVAKRLQRLSFVPSEVIGYVRLPEQKVCVSGCQVYELDSLESLSPDRRVNEVVIAIPPAEFSRIPKIMKILNRLCLPTRAVVDLGESIVIREKLFQLGNLQMLDLASVPTESLDYALAKRAFDISFSLIVLFLTLPLLAIIALLVRLTSPGPVFFVQERVGLNGNPFKMYKFRTMREAPVSESETQWTTREDARRTPIGGFLRKTSLDELPQFFNVLKGDMSVVGPRPERPHFVHKFLKDVERYDRRHALKVGITGWAQVNGWRGDTSIAKRVEHDLYYLQNWSFAFDLRIIVMTIFAGLINKNAY